MKKLLTIVLCVFAVVLYAQDITPIDSLKRQKMTVVESLKQTMGADSLKAKAQQAQNMESNFSLTNQVHDSTKVIQLKDKLLQSQIDADTLKPKKLRKIRAAKDTVVNKANRTTDKITDKYDQVNAIPTRLADSVAQKIKNGVDKVVNKPIDKGNNLAQKPQNALNKIQQKQQQNLNNISGLTDGKLPAGDSSSVGNIGDKIPVVEKLDVPDLKTDIPGLNNSGVSELGKGAIPDELSLDKANINEQIKNVTNVDIEKDIKNPLGEVKGYTEKPLDKIDDIKGMESVKEGMGKAGEINTEAKGYTQDLKAAQEGDLSGVESRIVKEVDGLGELKMIEEQKAQIESYYAKQQAQLQELEKYQDREALKAAALAQSKKMAVGHFGANQNSLKQAHAMLSGLKQHHTHVPSVKNLKAEKPNRLKNDPFIDRMIFGLDYEINMFNNHRTLDVAPYLGYRVTEKMSIQGGHVWKYSAIKKDRFSIKRTPIAGFRGAFHYYLFRGFSSTGIVELLQATTYSEDNQKITKRHHGYLLGLSKNYKIVKGLYGQGQILFNFGHKNTGPYQHPFNIRFGFYWNTKSEDKKESGSPKTNPRGQNH